MKIFIAKKINMKRIIKIISLVYYLSLIYILFFHSLRIITYNNINLIPFTTIIRYCKYYNIFTFKFWFLNIFGNIILFIPFGILTPLLINKPITIIKLFILTLLICFFTEFCQNFFMVGQFDVDDIILNTLGSLIGFLLLYLFKKKIN